MADERDTISIKLKLKDAAKVASEMEVVAIEADGLGDAVDRAGRKGKTADTSFGKIEKTISKLAKLAKWPAIIGQAVPLLSAAMAATYGLWSALMPLAGVWASLPAAIIAGAQGLGVFTLATHGVTEAVGGLDSKLDPEKFAKLSAPAQRFALVLNSLKSPIRDLQQAAQAKMFPGLTTGLKDAEPALRALRPELVGTAGVVGTFGERLGKLVGSQGFLSDLRTQAAYNNRELTVMGGAALHVVDAFRQLIVASRPLDTFLVNLIAGWSKSADAMATNGRETGRLQEWFSGAARTVGE